MANNKDKKGNLEKNEGKNPYVFFSFIGTILILISIIFYLLQISFLFQLFFNLGMVIIAVVVVEYLWKSLGGDPLLNTVKDLKNTISNLKDLERTGIVGIYDNRKDFKSIIDWINEMRSANEVDLMGSVLHDNFVSSGSPFIDIMKEMVQNRKCRFRILVLDPIDYESKVICQRARDEASGREENESASLFHMITDLSLSLSAFQNVKEDLCKTMDKKIVDERLNIKVIDKLSIYCQIIRIDDKMLVAKYLSHVKGSGAPTIEIHGRDKTLFKTFNKEFENMWNKGGRVWTTNDAEKLNEYAEKLIKHYKGFEKI